MEKGYTQLGTVLIDQRPSDSEDDGVIVVSRFKGGPYDGVQLSYDAGRRKLYLALEGALRLAFLLAAAVERYRHPVATDTRTLCEALDASALARADARFGVLRRSWRVRWMPRGSAALRRNRA
jgi:hypothetical protein